MTSSENLVLYYVILSFLVTKSESPKISEIVVLTVILKKKMPYIANW